MPKTERKRMTRLWWKNSALIGAVLLCVAASGCNKRPDNVLSESETVDLLTDLQLAEAYNNTQQNGVLSGAALQEAVLAAHGITKEQYDATMQYYGKNVDDYYLLYEKVEARLRKKSEKAGAGVNSDSENQNDIWPYSKFTYFSKVDDMDGLKFSIDPGDLQPGERLEWKINLTRSDAVEGVLGLEYTDGSAIMSKRSAAGSNKVSITLQTDTAKQAKRIFGIMKVPSHIMPLWGDSIMLIRSPFDSLEYSKIRLQQRVYPLKRKPVEVKASTQEPVDSLKNTP